MKIIRLILLVASTAVINSSLKAQVPTPVPGWPQISFGGHWALHEVPLFAYEEIENYLFYARITQGLDKFFMNGSYFPGWPINVEAMVSGADFPIADIDHDGKYEMITVADSAIGHQYLFSFIYLLDDNGTIMQGFPIRVQMPSFLNVADMDSDNEYEFLFYSFDSQSVNCVDRYGRPKEGWPIPYPILGPYGTASLGGAVGDLDLDGFNEYIISANWYIFAFRYDGLMQHGFPIVLPDTNYFFQNNMTAPSLGDINDDGYLEIITSGNDWHPAPPDSITWFVAVYDYTGQNLPGWPQYFPGQYLHCSPVPSDVNADGIPEIGIQFGYTLHFVDQNGNDIQGYPTSPSGLLFSFGDLIAVDVNGDSLCEIFLSHNILHSDSIGQDSIIYYGYGLLYAFDYMGNDIAGYPLRMRGENLMRPPVFGIDNATHRLYMAIVDDMSFLDTVSIELFQFPDSTGPPSEWPMAGHDVLRTRNYNFVDQVTSVKNSEEIVPRLATLRQNYPNPFNHSTMIEFTLPKSQHVTLSIYDILGRKVVDLYDEVLPAGLKRHSLGMDVPSGIYFYTLETENTRITRKMILIK